MGVRKDQILSQFIETSFRRARTSNTHTRTENCGMQEIGVPDDRRIADGGDAVHPPPLPDRETAAIRRPTDLDPGGRFGAH